MYFTVMNHHHRQVRSLQLHLPDLHLQLALKGILQELFYCVVDDTICFLFVAQAQLQVLVRLQHLAQVPLQLHHLLQH